MSANTKRVFRLALLLFSVFLCVRGGYDLVAIGHLPYRISPEQEHLLTSRLRDAALSFSGASLLGLIVWKSRGAHPSKLTSKVGGACAVVGLVGLAALCFDFGNARVHSTVSTMNQCLNNLREIERAKETWALTRGASNGVVLDWSSIRDAFPSGFPKCPEGGTYRLGKVGESVSCTTHSGRPGFD